MEDTVLPKAWESLMNSASFLPVIVKSIERVHDITWSMEPNIHDFFEMVYIKRGYAVFEISGQPAPIGPNDIIIIKPNQPHKFIVKSETDCDFIVLSFRFTNQMSREYSGISLEDFLNFVSGKESGPFISLKVSQKNDIITLLNRIIKERDSNEIGSEFINYLLIMELFVLLSRALKMEWESRIKDESPKLKELIRISVNYINNNFEREYLLAILPSLCF